MWIFVDGCEAYVLKSNYSWGCDTADVFAIGGAVIPNIDIEIEVYMLFYSWSDPDVYVSMALYV